MTRDLIATGYLVLSCALGILLVVNADRYRQLESEMHICAAELEKRDREAEHADHPSY